MVYDRTCTGRGWRPGLADSWRWGAVLYRALGRIDAAYGAASWGEALEWARTHAPDRPIGELQLWMHGKWGLAYIAGDRLDRAWLEPGHEHHQALTAVRRRLTGEDALWWFRTCETFGAEAGQEFARAWTDFHGCRAAGHTYVIHALQSGLHGLRPGGVPRWSTEEGLEKGDGADPRVAGWSRLREPNTISCLRGRVPEAWFD